MRKAFLMLTALLLLVGNLMAQTPKVVTGKVTDANGDALPGATVQIKGTRVGTVTNAEGQFTITLTPNAQTLVVSLIGMGSKDVEIGSSTTLTVVLNSSSSAIDEVVVVGYGSGRKASNVVGTMTTVSGKLVQDRPSANAVDALQGRVAGLQVFTSNGEPSASSSFRIHGVGSLGASSTPLVVMDGVPIDPSTIVSLNPQDFENISVLKDASATSIYGSRAANGVIYITTKKGSIKESTINVNSQYGVSNMIDNKYFNNFMNSQELGDFWVATAYRTQAQVDALRKTYPFDTRWDKVYYKENAPMYQTDINMSGGGGKTTYYISGGYYHQDGLAFRSKYDRYNLRANINSEVKSWLRLGINISGGYDKRQLNPYGTNSTNRGLALLAPPFYSPVDTNGVEYPDLIPGWGRYGPKYLSEKVRASENKALANLSGFIEIKPIENLTIKTQAGLEANDYRVAGVTLPSYLGSINNGNASESYARTVNRTITNTAEYRATIANEHHLTVLAGQEFLDYNYETFGASSTGQTDDRLVLITAGPSNRNVSAGKVQYSYLSYFGRLNYDFGDKYFFDASVRQDQSSRFGRDNRTAHFWSVGGMWRVSNEDFLKDITWVKDVTVRANYGTSGNSALDNNYLSLALVGTNQYDGQTGWNISAAGNPILSWESQKQATFGIGFRLLDRINANVEYYNRVTTNMLVDVPFPYTSGFSQITDNVGSLKNYGWDVTLSADLLKSNKAYITPRITFNHNKNRVTELFQGKQYWIIPNTGVSWAVGQPVSFFYPVFAGVNPATGDPQWYLPNENPDQIVDPRMDKNAVTSNFNTAVLQQSTGIQRYAPFTGGFGVDAGYEGFYLQSDWSFAQGKYLINNDRYFFENPNQFPGFNQSRDILDYWKKEGDVTQFPKYGVQFTQFDSRLIENASFLRMKAMTIGYNIPQRYLSKTNFFKRANIYATGRNLITISKYKGPDPEVDSNLTLGVNPNTKQYAFGLNLSF